MRSVLLALALVVAAASCLAKDPVTSPGTGGASNGGTTSKGGAPGTGGKVGTGGVTSKGGTTSNGGTTQPPATVDCTDTSSFSNLIQAQYGGTFIPVDNGGGKNYYMTSNWWNKYSNEAENINGLGFTMTNPNNDSSDSISDPNKKNNPLGFPSVYIGAYSGHNTTGSNLPKLVSSLTSVPTIFSTNATSLDTSNFNATYDVWLTANGTPLASGQNNPGSGGVFLMVWLYKPSKRQPRGSIAASGHFVNGVQDAWDVWWDNSTNQPPCVSYVHSGTPLSELQFDLNNFIKDAIQGSWGVTNSQYLSIIFAGFEVWGGGDGLQLKKFCANVK